MCISFQSRNRGSFDFKNRTRLPLIRQRSACFNLVIEVLLISREAMSIPLCQIIRKFQSRNRGSFDFKSVRSLPTMSLRVPFQSRNRGSFDFKVFRLHFLLPSVKRFNLVIEVLLISSSLRYPNCTAISLLVSIS